MKPGVIRTPEKEWIRRIIGIACVNSSPTKLYFDRLHVEAVEAIARVLQVRTHNQLEQKYRSARVVCVCKCAQAECIAVGWVGDLLDFNNQMAYSDNC